MTTAVQHRRGTTAEHAAFTGLEGELTIDTTKDTAVIHDGTLAGGYPLAKENLANVNTSGLSSIDGDSTASDDKFFIFDQSATSLKTITRAELNNAIEKDALANVAITGGTINGTAIGGTTAAAGAFTTLTTSSTVTLNGGTANGVAFLNGSKVLTTGSALAFDGSGKLALGNVAHTSFIPTTAISLGNSGENAEIRMGQQDTKALISKWVYNATVGSAYGALETYGQTNYIQFGASDFRWQVASSEQMRLTSSLLTVVPGATIQGLTVGRGAGAVATNTAVGFASLTANTSGSRNTAGGWGSLFANTSGASNTAFGHQSGFSITTGTGNSAFGDAALVANTTGGNNTALGYFALQANTTASNNTAVGYQAGYSNTTGTQNLAVGYRAAYAGVTASQITAVGFNSLNAVTGPQNTAVGANSANALTSGNYNLAVGDYALFAATTPSNNTAVGSQSLYSTTTGAANTSVGSFALFSNTTASNNTAVGYQAGYTSQASSFNTFVGYQAGYTSNAGSTGLNTCVGYVSGYSLTTGTGNLIIGTNPSTGAGYYMTTGSKNTLLGGFNGNQGGLDIRTANNFIVLSDGDGNPRMYMDAGGAARLGSGNLSVGTVPYAIGYGPQLFVGDGVGGAMAMLNAQSINVNDYPVVLTANAYSTGVNTFAYVTTGANASRIRQNQGAVGFGSADTGTAGAAITFTEIFSVKKDETLSLQGAGRQSGIGITFPATQVASANANTLDDYEEGNWTPAFTSTGASFTYPRGQAGRYVKVGTLVSAQFYLGADATGTLSNGIQISGLPFVSDATPLVQGTVSAWISQPTNLGFTVNSGFATVTIWPQNSGAGATALTSQVAGGYVVGVITYTASN